MSTDGSPTTNHPSSSVVKGEAKGPIVIDGVSYIPSSVLLTGIPKVSFKDDKAFGVVDPQGESPRLYAPSSELGFYYNDTRYLGIWETTFNGMTPVSLATESRFGGSTVVFSMTNRDFPMLDTVGRIRRDTFLIRRALALCDDVLYETVEIKNFDSRPHRLEIEQWAGSKFEDVFEVRGYTRAKRGRMLQPEEKPFEDRGLTILQYEGLDNYIRRTYVLRLFRAEKIRVSPELVGYFTRVEVPSKGTVALKSIVSFDKPSEATLEGVPYETMSLPEKMNLLSKRSKKGVFAALSINSDNAILNRALQNAQTDIHILLTQESPSILYPYAGIPWFSAPFGRDGMITAYQMLPWHPALARGVLDYAFETLGSKIDAFTDEQPGKVFHEMRRGEMAKTRELPFIPYYGSVDSTPLCLILLHEYIKWTKDTDRLKEWWPSALRALSWMDKWGDFDSDGFLEYAKQSPSGLVNQGWKDSHDSIMHADGTVARAPIRLCEVQGYAFRAWMGMSALAKYLGKTDLASRFRLKALQLRAQFSEQFWDTVNRFIYLALDGNRAPCAVRASNMGHCLWSQIVSSEQALEVGKHLMSEAMFTGYGIRTLADTEAAYNPLSYHNGSVWPHDNSLTMEGFRLYNMHSELERLVLGFFSVLESSADFRLPELFCGFRKRGNEPPVPYEVACKPQAWAAGSMFLMLKSMIGLSMEIDQDYVVFNSPIITSKINTLEIKGLKGKDWEMDVTLRKTGLGTSVDVSRKSGSARVVVVK